VVLVDSSVWIAYFKGTIPAQFLHTLIDTNTICINDLILAELVPSIIHHEEFELKDLLLTITNIPLKADWNEIIERIYDSEWWLNPDPKDFIEKRISDSRAAFLDSIYYVE